MAGQGGLGGLASQPPDPVQTKLQELLFEATNPSNGNNANQINVIKQFCDTVNMSPEGPILAARLLGHRVQSPQDQEALQALAVLEAAVKGCGSAFHQEIAKFKFLNEMIKLVSPKYLGSQRPQHVKQRVIELLFCWTREIPEERKIQEAYAMLKAQGVVTEDPEYVATAVFAPSLPPRQPELDEEQQQKLRKLLQSKNPEDLQTANMMIKSMVSKDEERMERLSKRLQQLQSVTSNVKLLDDMMASHRRAGSSSEERELMAELSSSCEKLRPGLYRLASELAEDDSSIGEVLAASDELTRVIDLYKTLVAGERTGSGGQTMAATNSALLASSLEPASSAVPNLLDLDPLSTPTAASLHTDIPIEPNLFSSKNILVEENLSSPSLSLSTPGAATEPFGILSAASVPSDKTDTSPIRLISSNPSSADRMSQSVNNWPVDHSADEVKEMSKVKKGMQDLDLLGETLLRENLTGQSLTNFEARKSEKLPLNSMKREAEPEMPKKIEAKDLTQELCESINTSCNITNATDEHKPKSSHEETKCDDTPKKKDGQVEEPVKWNDINIAMSKIQPNKAISPIQLGDQGGSDCLNVALHFTTNKISGWPGVAVTVLTLSSTLPSEVSNLKFTPVMPRGCKARLLSPSSDCLPPFSPFAPPPAVTQVMIVSCGTSEEQSAPPASIGYVLTYTMDGETMTEIGKDIKLPMDIWSQ